MKRPIVLEGICCLYSEQGIGPYYAFWESKYIHTETGVWDLDGLHVLENGDHLIIFDKRDREKIVWSGFISLWKNRRDRFRQRDVSGRKWAKWFTKKYPAKLTLGPSQSKNSS